MTQFDLLTNVDEDGTPVEQRINSPLALREMFDDLVEADRLAASTRTSIQGLINGAKPFTEQQLRDAGDSGKYNYNNRRAESIIDPRIAADFNLAFDTASAIRVSFTPGLFSDAYVANQQANTMSIPFTFVFKESTRTAEAYQRANRDRNETGLGFFFFPDDCDWRPKAVMRSRVFFNPSASIGGEDLTEVCVIDWKTISDMFNLIENETAAALLGWNIPNVKIALASFYYNQDEVVEEYGGNYTLAWESIERRKRNYDTKILSRQHEVFPFVRGYITERSGKVSQYIIPLEEIGETTTMWLFDSAESLDSMADVILPFPYDYGDGQLAGVKGLGHRIYAPCVAELRLLMRTHDAVDLSTSLMVELQSGAPATEVTFQSQGSVTVLDPSVTPVQTSFSPQLQPLFTFREAILRGLENTANIFRPNMEDTTRSNPQKTAEQIRAESSRDTGYAMDRLFFTYLYLDALKAQMFKRLLSAKCRSAAAPRAARKAAKRFWEMSESLGVNLDLYKKYGEDIIVKSSRSAGAGSSSAKLQSLRAAKMEAAYSMTAQGRQFLDREIVASQIGYENIDLLFPIDGNEQPSNASGVATLEVNDFYEGRFVPVGIDQDHATHIAVILGAMAREQQALEQRQVTDFDASGKLFEQGLPHAMRHNQLMAGDPTREQQVAKYESTISKLVEFYQSFAPMVEKLRQQRQEELAQVIKQRDDAINQKDKVQRDFEVKMAQVQADAQIKMANTQSINENRDKKTDFQRDNAGQKLIADVERKNAELVNKINRDNQEHMAKMQRLYDEMNAKKE